MWPGAEAAGQPGLDAHGQGRQQQDRRRRQQNGQGGHLHLAGFDLLAQILRRAANHQPGDEDGQDDEDQHAVEARADAAEDNFAQQHVEQGHAAGERAEAAVHGVDRAVGG